VQHSGARARLRCTTLDKVDGMRRKVMMNPEFTTCDSAEIFSII
jgi:hypothetical protein